MPPLLPEVAKPPVCLYRCNRVRAFTGTYPGSLRYQTGLVTVLETDPDLARTRKDDLTQLIQRLVALHTCRTPSNQPYLGG